MKFECKGYVLVGAIQQVGKARSHQQTHAYLQDIYLELDNHILTIRATNLEMSCEKSIPVKGIQNGSCIVHGETISKISNFLQSNDATITCELIDGIFSIRKEGGVIEIKTTPQEDFPKLPPQGEHIGTVDIQTFIALIKEVSFCAATTEIKPEIASVYIYQHEESLVAVATDSYRLAEKRIQLQNPFTTSLLIPQKHINDIVSILQDEEGDVVVSKHEGIVNFTHETTTLCVHIITGQFPDYRQLFPKEFTTTATILKEDLQKTLNITTYFTENYAQVKCILTNNTLTLHSRNEALGQATYSIQATQTGGDIEAQYNNRYFLDVLPHISGNQVHLSFTTQERAMFISGNDATFTYLLMPLNR